MGSAFIVRNRCPACHQQAVSEIYNAAFTSPPLSDYLTAFYSYQGGIDLDALEDGAYVLMECSGCGMVFQREVLSDALMYRLYEEWIDPVRSLTIYEAETGTPHVWAQLNQIACLLQLVGRQPSQITALDYGMGWGRWCQLGGGFGMDVYGHELSPSKIKFATSKGVKNLSAKEMHAKSFDFINADQVFEHLSDPLQTLKELVQCLRPGGFMRIGVPDGWDIKKRLKSADWGASKRSRNNLNPVAPLEHINCFNHRALVGMARLSGLEAIHMPSHHATSCIGRIRSMLRPAYYALRGSFGTTLYFRRVQ